MATAIGPDFICAGMPKAGTTWLFEQLFHHPDFWMSPIKEYHYFDTDFPKSTIVDMIEMSRENTEVFNRRRGRMGFPAITDREQQSFDDILSCKSGGVDLEEYARIFRSKGDLLSGDITPGYCVLGDDAIAKIARAFPDLKVIFLIRDPVSRCWSRLSMRERRHGYLQAKFEDIGKFKTLLSNAEATVTGFQSEIFLRWKSHFPESQIEFFFFDDIAENPKRARRKILSFLGADHLKKSGYIEPNHNRKSSREKVPMPEDVKKLLIDHFADDLRASFEIFGEQAGEWLRRYDLPVPVLDHAAESVSP